MGRVPWRRARELSRHQTGGVVVAGLEGACADAGAWGFFTREARRDKREAARGGEAMLGWKRVQRAHTGYVKMGMYLYLQCQMYIESATQQVL